MIKRPLRNLTTASILAGATDGAIADDAADADHQDSGRRHLRPWHGHVAGSAHFADRGSRDRTALSRWQDRSVVFVGRPAGCRLHPEYDRHSGSARRAGGAATRQSPSDDVPAHADRSAQSPPPAAGTGCSALTVQLKKLA